MTVALSGDMHRGPDTHANRPAGTAVGVGTLYVCTTHNLIYRSDGSAWSTYAAVLPPAGSTSQALIKNSDTDYDASWQTISGGGGGASWTNSINAALNTALTGWTIGSGTWTAETDRFRLNNASTSSAMRLHYNTRIPFSSSDVSIDIRIDSSTSTTSSRAGIIFGTPAASDGGNGILVALAAAGSTTQTTKIHSEIDALSNLVDLTLAAAVTHGTWMTLRVIRIGNVIDAYLDGTLVGSMWLDDAGNMNALNMGRFALTGFAVDASFRNLTYNTFTLAA